MGTHSLDPLGTTESIPDVPRSRETTIITRAPLVARMPQTRAEMRQRVAEALARDRLTEIQEGYVDELTD